MKIAAASYKFRNRDVDFNLSQIERALRQLNGQADMLCFGESFLQGFDSLDWDYETDKEMAIS